MSSMYSVGKDSYLSYEHPNKRYSLINIFLCAVLFPFVSPFPIETDTQPVAFIIASLILMTSAVKGEKFTYQEIFILILPVLGLLYINPLVLDSNSIPIPIGKYLSLLTGSVVYVAARRSFHRFSPKVFYCSIVVYFVFSILLMIAPGIFFDIQALVVRAVNTAGEENPFGYRGIPTLSTEPGLFGGLLVFQFLMLEYFEREGKIIRQRYWCIVAMLFFMVLATKSGTGYLYFILYAVYLTFRQRHGLLKLTFVVSLLVLLVSTLGSSLSSSSDLGRGFQIVIGILSQPEILMADTSTIGRLYDFFLGFVSLVDFPFGNGVNGVADATLALSDTHLFIRNYYGVSSIGLVSGLAWCFVAYGVFALFYFFYIYIKTTSAPIGARIFSLIFLSFSYSPAFPGIWVLLAIPGERKVHSNRSSRSRAKKIPPKVVRPHQFCGDYVHNNAVCKASSLSL